MLQLDEHDLEVVRHWDVAGTPTTRSLSLALWVRLKAMTITMTITKTKVMTTMAMKGTTTALWILTSGSIRTG